MIKRVLFYNDSAVFGGHEVSMLVAMEQLATRHGVQVGVVSSRANGRLRDGLLALEARVGTMSRFEIDFASQGPWEFLWAPFARRQMRQVRQTAAAFAPDRLVVVQGVVTLCLLGVLLGRRMAVPTISFIPIVAPPGSGIRRRLINMIFSPYYRLARRYIVTSQDTANRLSRLHPRADVKLVYFGIDIRKQRIVERAAARRAFGFTETDLVLAIIGRVQFVHKGHDILIEALARWPAANPLPRVLFVGDGPDLPALRQLVKARGLTERVTLLPWLEDLSAVYAAIDIAVIPSRYEGLPLVMLESMYHRRPVVASRRDGMMEVLPPQWLFEPEDSQALLHTLLKVAREDQTERLERHHRRIVEEFNHEHFGDLFYEALCSERLDR